MKKLSVILFSIIIIVLFTGCNHSDSSCDILTTTLPVYEFTAQLCQNTGLTVERLVSENVSCLHDYTLDVKQMRLIESADILVLSGAGLEDFMEDALQGHERVIDASVDVHIHDMYSNTADAHDHHEHSDHHHDQDPHIWLSPSNAKHMAQTICEELCQFCPEYQNTFNSNLAVLLSSLDTLQEYGNTELSQLSCRELITFHDGFGYFAESFDLKILRAVEEESGSEASAAEIIELIQLVRDNNLPAIFIERSGSDACAGILHTETGVEVYTLDMAMAGNSYFDAMYHNICVIKEALG